jgi:hypothetical protein
MTNLILLYLASFLTTIWGVAHLFPTRNVVDGFGEIGADNRNIITMEWIVEGYTLIFTGLLVMLVTIIDPSSSVSFAVYMLSTAGLIVLSLISLLTGFKVNYLPFKLCPLIFTSSAVLIILGALLTSTP